MNVKKYLIGALLFTGLCMDGEAQSPAAPKKGEKNTFTGFRYHELPLGAVRPEGWLLHQLDIMTDGTTGHLDEVHGKVKNDNGWLGGRGDGWEETPYWLDGAVPLAYLLDEPVLKNKILRYINWTLDNQRPSVYFCLLTKWERETGKKLRLEQCAQGED